MDFPSLVVGFVVGSLTGAAAHYFGEKFTDKRRSKELHSTLDKEWADLENRFPLTLAEMKANVKNPEFSNIRKFFVKSSRSTVNSSEPCFEYHTDALPDLNSAISFLEELGYIEDITRGNCPTFRKKEHFIDKLRNS